MSMRDCTSSFGHQTVGGRCVNGECAHGWDDFEGDVEVERFRLARMNDEERAQLRRGE
jgi:hypothetical protein